MPTILLVATTNKKKLKEIETLLADLPLEIRDLKSLPSYSEVEENGKSFQENASKKALGYARQSGHLTLAEDSGLCCEALEGAPGIYSARFSGLEATDEKNNAKILRLYEKIPDNCRGAKFVSCVAIATPEKIIGLTEGEVRGFIHPVLKGQSGYGYDPLFYYPPFGTTFADVSQEKKDSVSHRFHALQKAKALLIAKKIMAKTTEPRKPKTARKDFLVFGSPLIEQAEIDEVVACMKSGWLGTGPKVKKFEEQMAAYKGVPYAMGLNSCTAALHLSMLAIGLRPGDEVIVPTMTFAATANAVIHAGGRPILADCDRRMMNIDPVDVARKVTPKTQALLPVHFAGRPCDMDKLMELSGYYNLKVIEDCAHAIETEYHGKKAGTFGHLGCFSFYVTKNIVTGEGGMVITRNEEYANSIKVLGLHGMSKDAWKRFSDEGYKHYQIVYAGFKYNMMDLQAAIGLHQIHRVETYWKRREEIWNRYNQAFKNLPVFTPADPEPNTRHAYHLYTLLIDIDHTGITRDQFLTEMTQRNIGVGVHYIALHLHPYYQKMYGYGRGDFPNAEWISDRTVSIPLSPKLTEDDVQDIIEAVKEILG